MSRLTAQAQAKSLLVHYFETVMTKAGGEWDSDNTAEIEQAVDAIIEAAGTLPDSIQHALNSGDGTYRP